MADISVDQVKTNSEPAQFSVDIQRRIILADRLQRKLDLRRGRFKAKPVFDEPKVYVFCVHDNKTPWLELYSCQENIRNHEMYRAPDGRTDESLHLLICLNIYKSFDNCRGFIIQMEDCSLELIAPTESSRDSWVRTLQEQLTALNFFRSPSNDYAPEPSSTVDVGLTEEHQCQATTAPTTSNEDNLYSALRDVINSNGNNITNNDHLNANISHAPSVKKNSAPQMSPPQSPPLPARKTSTPLLRPVHDDQESVYDQLPLRRPNSNDSYAGASRTMSPSPRQLNPLFNAMMTNSASSSSVSYDQTVKNRLDSSTTSSIELYDTLSSPPSCSGHSIYSPLSLTSALSPVSEDIILTLDSVPPVVDRSNKPQLNKYDSLTSYENLDSLDKESDFCPRRSISLDDYDVPASHLTNHHNTLTALISTTSSTSSVSPNSKLSISTDRNTSAYSCPANRLSGDTTESSSSRPSSEELLVSSLSPQYQSPPSRCQSTLMNRPLPAVPVPGDTIMVTTLPTSSPSNMDNHLVGRYASGTLPRVRRREIVSDYNVPPLNTIPPPPILRGLVAQEYDSLLKQMEPNMLSISLMARELQCLAIVDVAGQPWIAGWHSVGNTKLRLLLHVGDLLISIHRTHTPDAKTAEGLIPQLPKDRKVTVQVQRVPKATVKLLNRTKSIDGHRLGLTGSSNGTNEIVVSETGVAYGSGLDLDCPSGLRKDGPSVPWFLTEVNGKAVSIANKNGEASKRLEALGCDVSIMVQPSDFMIALKQALKRKYKKNYKDYCINA